jgi:hypothetical protein
MISIDISIKEGIVENVHLGANCSPEEVEYYTALFKEFCDIFAWSYEEMPGIDPSIIVHEIKTYPGVKPVRQKLHPVHPKKTAAIKAEVEKLLKSGFIYPVPLTEWVSNIIMVAKKQGTIHVCVDYRDLNKACPKDNYPTPLSTKSSIIVLETSYFPSWMVSQGITRLIFYWLINIKQPSSALGGRSLIGSYLLVLKTLELLSNGPCRMLSTISNILWNLTLMIYLLIHLIDETILVTYKPSFFDVGFTISI